MLHGLIVTCRCRSRNFAGLRVVNRRLSMVSPRAPRRFAPLNRASHDNAEAPTLKGVIFDMDGTLCEPQNYMFAEMRSALGISKGTDILDHIHALPESEQPAAHEAIQAIERRAMTAQKAQPGLLELMEYLTSKSVLKAICTRNFQMPVDHLLQKFLSDHKFEPVLTRDFRPPKPDPAGLIHIAQTWQIPVDTSVDLYQRPLPLLMVGDSIDDMTAGHRAGAATVLLVNKDNVHLAEHQHTDLVIKRLDDLIGILEQGFVGQIPQDDTNPDTKKQAESALASS